MRLSALKRLNGARKNGGRHVEYIRGESDDVVVDLRGVVVESQQSPMEGCSARV